MLEKTMIGTLPWKIEATNVLLPKLLHEDVQIILNRFLEAPWVICDLCNLIENEKNKLLVLGAF